MTRPIYVSTATVRGQHPSLEALLDDFAANDISNIELGLSPAFTGPDLEAHLARREARFLIHNYFPIPAQAFVLNLASRDRLTLSRSRGLTRSAIELSARLGAPFYSVHAGFRADFTPESLGKRLDWVNTQSVESALATYCESIIELADHGARLGVKVLVEPNVMTRENLVGGRNELLLLVTDGEILEFLDRLGRRDVGILLDTGHLRVSATTMGFDRGRFVDAVADRIGAFHAHDNDGTSDLHRPIERGSWVLDLLREPRFRRHPVVIESTFPAAGDTARYLSWFSAEIG